MDEKGSLSIEQSYKQNPSRTDTEDANFTKSHGTSYCGTEESPKPSTSSGGASAADPSSTSTPSTSKAPSDCVAKPKDGSGKSRKRKRESFAWLYRDLSFEDEYNIGTVDGDELEDEDEERKEQQRHAIRPNAAPKPSPETRKSNPAVQNPSQPAAVRAPILPNVEFHFRQTFLNYSATKRKVRTRSCVVYWEPKEVYVSDLDISTHIEDDNATPRPHLVTARPEVGVRDECHLPLKKRRRFLNPELDT